MIPDLIRKQIRQGESLHTEFKADLGDMEAIAKTVCAFLNTEGGTIFCGVVDKDNVTGIADGANKVKRLHAYLLEVISPKALVTVAIDREGDADILSVDVPEGKDRPYVFDGRVFVRHKSVTRAADAIALRNMVQAKGVVAERWERRPSMALDLADIDVFEVRRTANEARERGRFAFEGGVNDEISILRDLAVYNSRGFTQAADVLFAKNPTHRHPQTRVRLTRFETDKGGSVFSDDKLLEGPLVRMLEQSFDYVSRNVRQLSQFRGDLRRDERPEYPLDALREGLVNAFAHRDYSSFSGGVSVGIYPDRIEIWNSGRFPSEVKPSDLSRSHPSVPTNPDIAQVMYLRNLMERIGRGGQLIVTACKEYGLPSPRWIDKPSGVTLTFYGSSGNNFEHEFNARQVMLLETLGVGERLTPADYRARFGTQITDRQARRDLGGLADRGYLLKAGSGPATYYERSRSAWRRDK